MAKSGSLSILLLDENQKKLMIIAVFLANEKGDWEPSISKKWNSALFANADFCRNLDLQPYQF
jgi:lycopene beta-cyclase